MAENTQKIETKVGKTGEDIVETAIQTHRAGFKRSKHVRGFVVFTTALATATLACLSTVNLASDPKVQPTSTVQSQIFIPAGEYSTSSHATANAVETQMPSEVEDILLSYKDVSIDFIGIYNRPDGMVDYFPSISEGGSYVIKFERDGVGYALFGMSGHQLSSELQTENIIKAKGVHADFKIDEIEIGGQKFDTDKVSIRYRLNENEDWGFILVRQSDISDPHFLDGVLGLNNIYFGKPPLSDNYYGVCKPIISGGRMIAGYKMQAVRYDEKSPYLWISYLANTKCSGSGMYLKEGNDTKIIGPDTKIVIATDGNGEIYYSSDAGTYPVFFNMGEENFNRMLSEMVNEVGK